VEQRDLLPRIHRLQPDYMAMGRDGMAEMGEMEMPLPDNTLPMMTGRGPYGPLEMGGMFTTIKVREGLGRDDHKDPGWYRHPPGTVASEFTGSLPAPPQATTAPAPTLRARKPQPGGHAH
jgi:hypothetical protein